jgi:5-methylcytosine-specific restriction endonuclease McrA
MDSQPTLFDDSSVPLPKTERSRELSELIARYRVMMNQMVARMLYLERQFRRASDGSAKMVCGFVDSFLESCSSVPDVPEEWDGGKCFSSDEVYTSVRLMYVAARDLRRAAKSIVTIRRHFYRDLKILQERHGRGQSAFDKDANLRINERRQWTNAERKKVWERSEKQCRYCGAILESPNGDSMHIDHIVPVVAGGGDDLDNLAAACIPCNLKKNAKSEERFLAELLACNQQPLFAGTKTESRPSRLSGSSGVRRGTG